jgi:quercetin dioxygenase-like cupin family protein
MMHNEKDRRPMAMFLSCNSEDFKPILEGVGMRTLVYGAKTLMAEFRLARGADLPTHQHPHEQTGWLASGRIDLTINGVVHAVRPGDSWCIPGGVPHSARAREDSLAVEVFAPVREDYLP